MVFLSLEQVLEIHRQVISRFGGADGVLHLGSIESALARCQASYFGHDPHPTLPAKAAALCYSLVANHPFRDGNKRVGYTAMRIFLQLNGHDLAATVDEAEQTILALAAGKLSVEQLTEWVSTRLIPLPNGRSSDAPN